jgi:hypothetical protein
MNAASLNENQIALYQDRGYLIIKGFLSADEALTLAESLRCERERGSSLWLEDLSVIRRFPLHFHHMAILIRCLKRKQEGLRD